MLSGRNLCDVFVEVADALIDQYDGVDLPRVLVDHIVSITGAASAGLLLAKGSQDMAFITASNVATATLEQWQLEVGEGPCLDCHRAGEAVVVSDLNAAARWPRFTEVALDEGIQSVHAVPMRLGQNAIGALDIFGAVPLPFDDDDIAVVQAVADVATIGILREQAVASAELVTAQLRHALNSRVAIEQAKGFLASTYGIDVNLAFAMLRSHARSNGLRLTDLCRDVADGKVRIAVAVRPGGVGYPRR